MFYFFYFAVNHLQKLNKNGVDLELNTTIRHLHYGGVAMDIPCLEQDCGS